MYVHQFNEIEGLRIAEEIEKQGAQYYRQVAKISCLSKIHDLLESLANDEDRHAEEFKKMAASFLRQLGLDQHNKENISEVYPYFNEETSAFLSSIAGDLIFSSTSIVKQSLEIIEDGASPLLKRAIQMEKDSILFYQELISCAKTSDAINIFKDVICEERRHLISLQDRLDFFEQKKESI